MSRRLRIIVVSAVVWVVAVGTTAWAQEEGLHIVRPGETLRGITNHYLGSDDSWQENWKLNPEVSNPDYLVPGQRIRVRLKGGIPPQTARVSRSGRSVEAQPTPVPWLGALSGDVLMTRDGLRTPKQQSAELVFPDGERLVLGESSLVFLRGDVASSVPERRNDSVEIMVGQADLSVQTAPRALPEIEILMGPAAARPRADESGAVETRARRPESGGAQVMVFAGASIVEAGGESVEVLAGTGTQVPEIGPPTPPEPLLPAPEMSRPEAGAVISVANPRFSWKPVEGAGSYILEICADPDCALLVHRLEGLEEAQWQSERVSSGTHYWRATAVSPTGLDGFPPDARELTVDGVLEDLVPPTADIRVQGPHVMMGGLLVVGASTRLEGVVEDEVLSQMGIEGDWVPILDGEETDLESWAAGWPEGEHEVSGYAVDAAGLTSEPLGPIRILSDPVPPEIHWATGDIGLVESHGVDQHWDHEREGRLRRKAHADVILEWSPDGRRWNPFRLLTPEEAGREPGEAISTGSLKSDHPQLFVRGMKRKIFEAPGPATLGKGDFLRIWVEDSLSAVRELRVRVLYSPEKGHSVEFQAWDVAGNSTREIWPFAAQR